MKPKLLTELYSEPKYAGVLYYLTKDGILNSNDLEYYDFDKLLHHAELGDRIVHEARRKYLTELYKSTHGKSAKDSKILRIVDVYQGKPRSASFLRDCQKRGLIYMDELRDEDFQNLEAMKGIGVSSAARLRQIYDEYKTQDSMFRDRWLEGIQTGQEDVGVLTGFSFNVFSPGIRRSLVRVGITTIEKLLAYPPEKLANVQGIGKKALADILRIRDNYLAENKSASVKTIFRLGVVPDENRSIQLSVLAVIGLSDPCIDMLHRNGFHTVGDVYDAKLTAVQFTALRSLPDYLSIPVAQRFAADMDKLKDAEKRCMEGRTRGATLQVLSDQMGVTRERVRQIVLKASSKLKISATLVAASVFPPKAQSIPASTLETALGDEKRTAFCKLALQNTDYVKYLKFADIYVRTRQTTEEIDAELEDITQKVIGEGGNYLDAMDRIEQEFKRRGMSYLNVENYMNYLSCHRFRFCGDYVMRGKHAYGYVCCDAIRKYFPFDIKLNQDHDNEDMKKLRAIIAKHYNNMSLPPDNRSLATSITRITGNIILSGRGRYCPIEKVIYDPALIHEVCEFIRNSDQSSFYYSEIYDHFRDRFQAETNIDNHHFLHGILKYLYADEYAYERDILVKKGGERLVADDRIISLLLSVGRAVNKEEVKKEIPGINDFVISFAIQRIPELFTWEYNQINHINNIKVGPKSVKQLRDVVSKIVAKNDGYADDMLLYREMVKIKAELVTLNDINEQNLFYIASYLLRDEYRFRRPHITTMDFPVEDLTTFTVIDYLLKTEDRYSYSKVFDLMESLEWSGGSKYGVFAVLQKSCLRISEDEYVKNESVSVTKAFCQKLKKVLQSHINEDGYCIVQKITRYREFPSFEFRWNSHLLLSLIEQYDVGFRLLNPQISDRRFRQGVIVPQNSTDVTLDALIHRLLVKDGIQKISEPELEVYLRDLGIIYKTIPGEFYSRSDVRFDGEEFHIASHSD